MQGLARYTPTHVAAWHLRRLLAARRWPWALVLAWLVSETLAAFPPPKDGVLYLVVDSTLKGKRTKQNPLIKKSRLNEYAPYTFGLHVVILIAQWDVYRVPLAFRLVKPKGSAGYQSANVLFREMLREVVLPAWCKKVVVVADAAYPSRANLQAIQARGWFFVIAFPRTWKLANTSAISLPICPFIITAQSACLWSRPVLVGGASGHLPNGPSCGKSEMSRSC